MPRSCDEEPSADGFTPGSTSADDDEELAGALLDAIALAAKIGALLAEAPEGRRRAVESRRRMVLSLVAAWPEEPPAARPVGFSGGA